MKREIRALYEQVHMRLDKRWARPLLLCVHFLVALVLKSHRDRLFTLAAMLTYWTSVAVVPMLLLAFALTGALGLAASPVRELLYDVLLASSITEVREALDNLLTSTNLGTLGALGILGVLFIGAQLFFQTEHAYNAILYTRPTSSLLNRFFMFYTALTLGPLLLTAGFVLTSHLTSWVPFGGSTLLTNTFSYLLPSMVTAVVLSAALRFLPSIQLSWRAVLWGGLSSALLFEAAKRGFSAYTLLLGTKDSMTRIYGSLGLLPVFLIWVNLLWTIVLLGVEVAYIRENWEQLVEEHERWVLDRFIESRQVDLFFMFSVLSVLARRYQSSNGGTGVEHINKELGADSRQVRWTLDTLCLTGLVKRGTDNLYLPALPLEQTLTQDAIKRWRAVTSPQTHEEHPGRALEAHFMGSLKDVLNQPLAQTLCLPLPPPASPQ